MTLSPTLKWTLAASLAAAAYLAVQPDDEAALPAAASSAPRRAPVAPSVSNASPAPGSADADEPTTSARAREPWAPVDPVALVAWGTPLAPPPPPPPAAPPPSPPPAPPQAPPFPYTLIGRIDDELGPQLLLTGPVKTIAARAKDVIDGQWRLDAIQPGGATLTWLPGSLQQTLSFRAS